MPAFRVIGRFGGVYPPPSQTWRLGLLIGSPAHFVEEVHRLDRKFHAALVAYGLAHGVEVADRDARYVGAGAHLVDEVLRRGELIQLDQRLGPLQDDRCPENDGVPGNREYAESGGRTEGGSGHR